MPADQAFAEATGKKNGFSVDSLEAV